jgi:hypothetical protein
MMQNASDHGVDLMARYANGDWISFEIKASKTGTHRPLSKKSPTTGRIGQNSGADAYTRDRLGANANQAFQWTDRFRSFLGLDSRSQVAQTVLNDMKFKNFDGYVVSFTNWDRASIKSRIKDWN